MSNPEIDRVLDPRASERVIRYRDQIVFPRELADRPQIDNLE